MDEVDELCYCDRCFRKFPNSEMEMIGENNVCQACNPQSDTYRLHQHRLNSIPRRPFAPGAVEQVWEAIWEAGREDWLYSPLPVNKFY